MVKTVLRKNWQQLKPQSLEFPTQSHPPSTPTMTKTSKKTTAAAHSRVDRHFTKVACEPTATPAKARPKKGKAGVKANLVTVASTSAPTDTNTASNNPFSILSGKEGSSTGRKDALLSSPDSEGCWSSNKEKEAAKAKEKARKAKKPKKTKEATGKRRRRRAGEDKGGGQAKTKEEQKGVMEVGSVGFLCRRVPTGVY